MRLVFLGSPPAAVTSLRALVEHGHDVALVVTQPDRKRGRGGALSPSPVKSAAVELGLPVSHRVDDAIDVGADLGVVVAFGQLVKAHVLDALPMVNVHFSLLPRWRGAAPVERAILAGDATTGVCLMALDVDLDTGPVYDCASVAIGAEETAVELTERLADLGASLLVQKLAAGLGEPIPQQGEATYAAKLTAADFVLRWDRPATELARVVRLGRAWTNVGDKRLRVLRARSVDSAPGPPGTLTGTVVATGDGGLDLVDVQPEGKGVMAAADWARGAHVPGGRLGDASGG